MINKYVTYSLLTVAMGWLGAAILVRGTDELLERIPDYTATTLLYRSVEAAPQGQLHRYYLSAEAPPAPDIKAKSYIVADLATGDVLLEYKANTVRPIASVSKLTTILTAIDMRLPMDDLVYPLLLPSSNSAAEAIARLPETGFQEGSRNPVSVRTNFIKNMNNYVAKLGMDKTHYADPSGLSPLNISTARNLLVLAQHIYYSHNDVLQLTLLPQHGKSKNSNLFVQARNQYYIGGKSGFTEEAGGTLVSLFNLPVAGGEARPIVVVVLGTSDDKGVKYELSKELIEYLLEYVSYR